MRSRKSTCSAESSFETSEACGRERGSNPLLRRLRQGAGLPGPGPPGPRPSEGVAPGRGPPEGPPPGLSPDKAQTRA
ncbi:hypothetical protein F0U62_02910 [Cystobacter fuscus]|nr:hypothetical protein F0U62_02910 [Cystobacter fuscus]